MTIAVRSRSHKEQQETMMAADIVMCVNSLGRIVLGNICKFGHPLVKSVRDSGKRMAHSSVNDRDSWTVIINDGSTIVCWHPEKPFPYEHTKPLPEVEPELREEDSVLKVQYRLEDKHRYKPRGPSMEDLQKITYTTKHRWFPKPEKKYRKPNPPRDREGI